MLCIYNTSTEPYFNISTEEYLQKNFDEDILMLWGNDKEVIVGKHKNSLAEINSAYGKTHNSQFDRRMLGR